MTYLDTSAMVRAWRLAVTPEAITRAHSVAEFYSTLTGGITVNLPTGPVRIQFAPEEAAQGAATTFARMTFRDLTGAEAISELAKAAAKNVHAANVHDWMHAAVASREGCREIVTANERHFKTVTTIPLATPDAYFGRA